MKIKVNEKGAVYLDDNELKTDEITAEFLEKIVNESLNNNVEYELDEDENIPMVKLFKELKELCEKDSEFRDIINQIDESIEKSQNDDFDDAVDKELEDNNINDEEDEELPF